MPTISRRPIVAVATLALSVVGFATAAAAHVDPDPPNVPAGASVTVGFLVEHGCDDSPTISVAIRMPEGVSEARPLDKAGWLVALEDNVATFVGGRLEATAEDSFLVSFVAPTAVAPLVFPVVQTCEIGEIVWGEVAEPGQPEPESPPAVIAVVAPAETVPPETTVRPAVETLATTPPLAIEPAPTAPALVVTATRPTTWATTVPQRSSRDLLIGATVGTAVTAAIAVALNRRQH